MRVRKRERETWRNKSFDSNGFDNISSETQPATPMYSIFNGSFNNDRRLVQLSHRIHLKLDSRLMLSGRQTKSFPLRFKCCNGNKQPISLGITMRLQFLRSNLVKEHALYREDNSKSMGSGLLGEEIKGRSSSYHDLDWNDDNCLHPWKDSILRFFKRPMEEGTCLIAVHSN